MDWIARDQSMHNSYGRDVSYVFPTPGTPVEYQSATRCEFFEITQHSAELSREYIVEEGSLIDGDIDGWLTRHKATTDSSDLGVKGRLRILYATCGFNYSTGRSTIPFAKSSFEKIEAHNGLPPEFNLALTGTTGRAFKLSCPEGSGNETFNPSSCFIFRFGVLRPSFYQIALSYSPTNNTTVVLLLAKTQDHEFPLLLQNLIYYQKYIAHPLLTAALLSKIVYTSTARRIQAVNQSLNDMEDLMGQHEYNNIELRDPLEADFMAATRKLNFAGRAVGVEKMRCGAQGSALKIMLQEADALISSVEGVSRAVREIIVADIDVVENLMLRAEYEENRVTRQLAVVYQFMAMKEALASTSLAKSSATIARESKRDSSAMKAIAILTMFFLPGTFLAAVFAMPVFDWDEGSHPVIKDGFRYYWAITVPVTVAVLVLWGLSIWLPWHDWFAVGWEKFREAESRGVSVRRENNKS